MQTVNMFQRGQNKSQVMGKINVRRVKGQSIINLTQINRTQRMET